MTYVPGTRFMLTHAVETAVAGLANAAPDCDYYQRSQGHHHDPIVSPSHYPESIEGGALEVTLHRLASHLSFHLLPDWGQPPPDRNVQARGSLQNLL
jgi:hypothetical protein